MISAFPRIAAAPGAAAGSSSSISGSGSIAVTRCPSATSARVSFPVPAPRSTTSRGSSPASQRTASSGYPGRPRSYAPATSAKAVYGPRAFGSRLTITPASVAPAGVGVRLQPDLGVGSTRAPADTNGGRLKPHFHDLGNATAQRHEARNDVEHALAGAECDVVLELGRVLEQVAAALRCAEGLLRPAPRAREPRRRLGGIAPLPGREARRSGRRRTRRRARACPAPPRTRRSTSSSAARAASTTAERLRSDATRTRSQRCRRGDDCTRSVRGREDQRLARGLEVLARRVSEIEARDPHRVPLTAQHALCRAPPAAPAPPRPRRCRTPARSRRRAPGTSSSSPESRR